MQTTSLLFFTPMLKAIALSLSLLLFLAGCTTTQDVQPSRHNETVVIIHGLARSGFAMRSLTGRIEKAGYRTFVVDYSSLGRPMGEVVNDVTRQVNSCCHDAVKVHFVGHSLGGLLTRAYFSQPQSEKLRQKLGQVIMIGTPNQGSAIVDHYEDRWWMNRLGDTTLSLGTTQEGFPQKLPLPDFRPGVIAGTNGWFLSDRIFGEKNDGLVAASSTKLANMADYVEIDVGHSMMRFNKEVAKQTLYFLEHGQFSKAQHSD
ncbi:MAG: alpha/beta fold hydrolase [Endozoicomonas sp.]|uniref:alpha/beta fold hydrolase n=1 Tax=Endozoicomonas sp. TaxID=1892382 RepID=UPI003D9B9B16